MMDATGKERFESMTGCTSLGWPKQDNASDGRDGSPRLGCRASKRAGISSH